MIILDGKRMGDREALHAELKEKLGLPSYYGGNLDALNDCLGERTEPVNLWVLNPGTGDVASAIAIAARVIRDNGGEVKEL